ncbi:MAG: hypothetical protein WBA17_09920, partial [Saprospiraceae bacterium]
MRQTILLLLFACLALTLPAQLATWTFEVATNAPATAAANLTAGNATFGSGVGNINYFGGNGSANGYSASSWPMGGLNATDYLEFRIEADPGFTLNVNSFSLDMRRSGSGPSNFDIIVSTSTIFSPNMIYGGAIDVALPTNTSYQGYSYSGTVSGEVVIFRVYGINSSSDGGTLRFDNVVISGTVDAAPAAPANDLCNDAEILNAGVAICANNDMSTNTGAINCSNTDLAGDNGGNWYTFTGNGAMAIIDVTDDNSQGNGIGDTEVNVYTGTCANLTCLASNDDDFGSDETTDSRVTFPTTSGEIYLVYVDGNFSDRGDYCVILTLPTPPNLAPVIAECPDDPVLAIDPTTCMATIPDLSVGLDISDDNDTNAELTFVQTPAPGTMPAMGTTQVDVSLDVTDTDGETTNCSFTLFFESVFEVTFTNTPPTPVTVECDNIPPPSTEIMATSATTNTVAPFVFVSEFHYDNSGTDVNEFIEVSGTAGFDLTGYMLVLYNGSNGAVYGTTNLSGVIDDEGDGFGAISVLTPGLQNGAPDGFALVDGAGNVLEFLSYEGSFAATAGPAMGLTSTDVGAVEGAEAPGQSIQRTGSGCSPDDFTFSTDLGAESPGTINAGITFDLAECDGTNEVAITVTESTVFLTGPDACANRFTITRTYSVDDPCTDDDPTFVETIIVEDNTPPTFDMAVADTTINCDSEFAATEPVITGSDNCGGGSMTTDVWINEFHYDNAGGDTGEFIEVAGTAGTNLMGYSLVLYNGSGGVTYNTMTLMGTIPNQSANIGTLSFGYPANGIQNGAPDGFALVGPDGTTVIQFLSYEGSFTATEGPANGLTSTDIMGEEPGSTPIGQSLQLTGSGNTYSDFTWSGPAAESPGSLNNGQTVTGDLVATVSDVITPGANDFNFTIERTLTLTDECGNENMVVQTITVQDTTAPVLVCRDTTVALNAAGTAMLDNAQTVTSVTDNCDPNPTGPNTMGGPGARTFSCAQAGTDVSVTFVSSDASGNEGSCTIAVSVID